MLSCWQVRNRQWKDLGIDSGRGRDEALLGQGMARLAAGTTLTGTSIFDPTLCESAYTWFAPRPGRAARRDNRPVIVLDPFAGGSVRGIVAAKLGLLYIGIDMSSRQVEANKEQLCVCKDCAYEPEWIVGDGEDAVRLFRAALRLPKYAGLGLPPDTTPVDMVLSCPPYFDLEQYGGGDGDLSMMSSYGAFLTKYTQIITNVCSLLRTGHTATFVVGNIRSKTKGGDGRMLPLHMHTTQAFDKAGMVLVNDAVLLKPVGTGAMRADRTMSAASKLISVHQNVCVFSKGEMLTPALARAVGIRPNNAEASQSSQQ